MPPKAKILIDNAIPATKFSCDLHRCKGACCTMPGHRGAPLLSGELEEIRSAYPVIKKYLSEEHQETIHRDGMFQGKPGDYTTQVVRERACVFTAWENGIAKCSFEKAYFAGELSWRKPISCHLFPIRIDNGIPERLRFEYITECKPALERGEVEDMPLAEFLKSALVRAYGEQWYNEFLKYCHTGQQSSAIDV